jgi:serine/threonine protein kinase
MQVQRFSTGHRLSLDRSSTLGAGGEARIYTVPQDAALVAKVYHAPDKTQARKLAVMIAQPPDDPMVTHGHISIAWPIDLLCTVGRQRQVIGFLMPRVTGMRALITCYNPVTRRQQWPLFSYRYLLRTAHNLAAAVRALHARGYVIGDVNESNILVTDTALVTLVDTDSFQVHEPRHGVVYRCLVGKPEYTPPELQGRPFMQVDRTVYHDLFGIAVLIFQLLMEGAHPFAGVYQGAGDPPPYEARIANGHFPHGSKPLGPYRPMPSAPPFTLLHPTLQEMFVRCFDIGHTQPHRRPEAQAWQHALHEAEQALTSCSANEQHVYSNHLDTCPWCARTTQLGGRDPFPSRQAVQQQQPLPPPLPRQSSPRISGTSTAVPASSRQPHPQPSLTVAPASHPTMATPSLLSQTRPSWLWSICTGMFWGAIAGVLMSVIVYVMMHRPPALNALPAVLVEAGLHTGWSVGWGIVWGGLWGLWRRPALATRIPRFKSMLTGAVCGAVLGIVASTLLGLTPGLTAPFPQDAFLLWLKNATWNPPLPAMQDILRQGLLSLRLHAVPGAIVGTGLGTLWGMWRR